MQYSFSITVSDDAKVDIPNLKALLGSSTDTRLLHHLEWEISYGQSGISLVIAYQQNLTDRLQSRFLMDALDSRPVSLSK